MKWYKRLFWKVFVAIWSVSFLVLLATVIVIGAITEKDRFRDVVTTKAEGYAELMVERYELKGFRTLRTLPAPSKKYRKDHDHHDRHSRDWRRDLWINFSQRVYIKDIELNRKVIGPVNFDPTAEDRYRFFIHSERGREYQVEVDLAWESSPFLHLIGRILSAQLVLILLVSALGALLVSAIISRPLKLLRQHTQAIYRGELDTRTDEKLRKRGDELGELARDFDQMAEYVQQTIIAHQQLMQDVSHELRAPLARLQAAAGIAEQRLGVEDKAVLRIIQECEALDQLIAEILSLSRLEQMERGGDSVELGTILTRQLDDARFAYPQRSFNLSVQSDCTIKLNPQLLERALNNIIGNACKHTPTDASIDISIEHAGDCILRIRDHGPGVEPDVLAHLCEPFYRGDSSSEGYGLGLSIAHRAVQRLGGALILENHPEGGLEVSIHLPGCEEG
ncbi:ATP-binding protein [uncultured Neptuniibacter sp.]|uniref:sensor histidine kinase n=1 Tax=uncultured Neptuniibacter sp. TaxID=502143 RepID=UPI0026151A23|nr:ATP-binding protein [uncultured Neptuniibacter sp.]